MLGVCFPLPVWAAHLPLCCQRAAAFQPSRAQLSGLLQGWHQLQQRAAWSALLAPAGPGRWAGSMGLHTLHLATEVIAPLGLSW